MGARRGLTTLSDLTPEHIASCRPDILELWCPTRTVYVYPVLGATDPVVGQLSGCVKLIYGNRWVLTVENDAATYLDSVYPVSKVLYVVWLQISSS